MTKPHPYQPGDFRKDKEKEFYRGPIYDVIYPGRFDGRQEMMDWLSLGFSVETSFTYDAGKDFTIVVLGDIPDEVQDRLQAHGVRTNLRKPRGEEVSLPL